MNSLNTTNIVPSSKHLFSENTKISFLTCLLACIWISTASLLNFIVWWSHLLKSHSCFHYLHLGNSQKRVGKEGEKRGEGREGKGRSAEKKGEARGDQRKVAEGREDQRRVGKAREGQGKDGRWPSLDSFISIRLTVSGHHSNNLKLARQAKTIAQRQTALSEQAMSWVYHQHWDFFFYESQPDLRIFSLIVFLQHSIMMKVSDKISTSPETPQEPKKLLFLKSRRGMRWIRTLLCVQTQRTIPF